MTAVALILGGLILALWSAGTWRLVTLLQVRVAAQAHVIEAQDRLIEALKAANTEKDAALQSVIRPAATTVFSTTAAPQTRH